ncbi:hypothetical protein HGH93_23570 [Chitinophaga polysaccharea]|uniref:hypothetical protein n=1 Tax=Chitinophaga polysaccharea TaxID=1293035 RepID=UPI001455718B|nr:hypothetical protein [Chitinophaga polysaccharea]NLR61101.1 hypothetical protein [Chitinophaga polysaccharea]
MSIKGDVKEEKFFSKRVGLAPLKPLVANPTKKELSELLGKEISKEPEYKITLNNTPTLKLDLWVEEVSTGMKTKIQMLLQDQKAELASKKVQYIDKKGNTSFWVNDTSGFKDWFLQNDPWIARRGEAALYKFLRSHTGKLDKVSPNTVRKIDWKALLKGDVSEINEIQGQVFTTNILGVLTVRMGKVDGGFKEFQSVYNEEFLPEKYIYFYHKLPEDQWHQYNMFVRQVTDPKNGCKEFFGKDRILKLAYDYDPAENKLATDNPIIKPSAGAQSAPASYAVKSSPVQESGFEDADFNGEDDEDLDSIDMSDFDDDDVDDNY